MYWSGFRLFSYISRPLLGSKQLVICLGENTKTHRYIFRGLWVVLEDDSNVHVDDNEKADDQIAEQEGDADGGVATVPRVTGLGVS